MHFTMKKLFLTLIVSLVSLSMSAQTPREIFKIIDMSWQQQIPAKSAILTKNGLKVLVSETEPDEEICFYTFIYGKGAKVRKVKVHDNGFTYEQYSPVALASNAVVIHLELSTDNGIYVYFKNKASQQAFLKYARTRNVYVGGSDFDSKSKMYKVYLHF